MAMNTIGGSGNTSAVPIAVAPQGASAPASRTSDVVPTPAPAQPSREQVQKAVESVKQLVQSKAPNSLSFAIDDATGKTIVRVSDAQTGEMIRQIPSEELLEIARSLDKLQGMLLQQEA